MHMSLKFCLTLIAGLGMALPASAQISTPSISNPSQETLVIEDNSWAQILQSYGDDSADVATFDYAALSGSAANMAALSAYINELAAHPDLDTRDEALSYWANLYNALTVQVVAESWPVSSIKEIKSGVFSAGPWKRELINVQGKVMSLDDIEHGVMRKKYDEPRVHYMVNCASIGCPNLKLTLWDAATLERDLDAAARAYINSERGARVTNGKLIVSSIYKWFKEDFGGNDKAIIAHLTQYADKNLAEQLSRITKISAYHYDWAVNAPQ